MLGWNSVTLIDASPISMKGSCRARAMIASRETSWARMIPPVRGCLRPDMRKDAVLIALIEVSDVVGDLRIDLIKIDDVGQVDHEESACCVVHGAPVCSGSASCSRASTSFVVACWFNGVEPKTTMTTHARIITKRPAPEHRWPTLIRP